jgi:hypothetical protein
MRHVVFPFHVDAFDEHWWTERTGSAWIARGQRSWLNNDGRARRATYYKGTGLQKTIIKVFIQRIDFDQFFAPRRYGMPIFFDFMPYSTPTTGAIFNSGKYHLDPWRIDIHAWHGLPRPDCYAFHSSSVHGCAPPGCGSLNCKHKMHSNRHPRGP